MIHAGENTCNLGASFLPISLLSGPNSVLEIDQFVFVGRCLFEVVFTLLPGLSLRVLQHRARQARAIVKYVDVFGNGRVEEEVIQSTSGTCYCKRAPLT